MKKFITLALAVAMVLIAPTSIFATTISSENKEVTAKYVDSTTSPVIYSVDIVWDSMQFTYTVSGEYDWDADEHEYDEDTQGVWTSSANTVTVANHSNADVTADVAFTNSSSDEITGSFAYVTNDTNTADGITLTSGVDTTYANADSFTATLSLKGDLAETTSTSFNEIGSITITLS